MLKSGWKGRPILVIKSDRYYAMTGAHRIAAARLTQTDVPVLYIDDNKFRDDILVEVLRRSGDTHAANLLREEWEVFNTQRGLENANGNNSTASH